MRCFQQSFILDHQEKKNTWQENMLNVFLCEDSASVLLVPYLICFQGYMS